LVPLDEEIPLERGHQRGVSPLKIVILPLLAHLADELSSGTNIDDLERP